MDIVVWLRSLGLGKYEAAFRENEIDETVLPGLTEEHLKQLGVTALGHRLRQLESHRGEITALFFDLRGFTGFTESADAEDVMALLRDYHAAIGEIIIKYNGTLERYAGDGVMVVFNDSVPVENPALQAVLMALELRGALGTLTAT
jgi:class 3 adenylate cyclase